MLSFPNETVPHQPPNDNDADENADLHNISIQLSPSPSKVYHPSDAINRFLLDSEPRANIAVTHDSQWMHVFQEDFPPVGEDELIEPVRRCFQVEYDSDGTGSVYLRERAWEGSPSPKDNGKGKNHTEQDDSEGVDTASQSTRENAPGGAPWVVARSPQAAAASIYSQRIVVEWLLGFMLIFAFGFMLFIALGLLLAFAFRSMSSFACGFMLIVVFRFMSLLAFRSMSIFALWFMSSSWLVEEILQQSIDFNSFLTQMIFAQPRISTAVITRISLASIALFCLSVKEAIRVFMPKPGTLVEPSAGVAPVKNSLVFWREYLKLAVITCFALWVLSLLIIGGTTLLAPTPVSSCYHLDGTELSITSPAFSDLLAIELGTYGPTISHDAGIGFGMPGIINFNQAKYNHSTGGLLPAIKSFAGSQTPPSPNGTRMQFSGGIILVNSTIHGPGSDWRAIQKNYSVHQQGVTADVNCQRADANSQVLNFTGFDTTLSVTSIGSTSPAYTLVAWNSTAKCNTNGIATQQRVTVDNASGQPDFVGTGFLSTITCPGHKDPSDARSRFVIAMQGFYKYNFLPSTICEVTPLITTTRVDYTDGGIINASQIISTQTFSVDNTNLLFYLASVVDYHARNSQDLMNNIIGDTLYSIYSAEFNTPISNNTDAVYRKLEDYWRGVIEFSATFLRAGYSAQGAFQDGIPSNMTSPLNGTMAVLTMGWVDRSLIYISSILLLGIVTLLTVLSTFCSFPQLRKEQEHHDSGRRTSPSHERNVYRGSVDDGNIDRSIVVTRGSRRPSKSLTLQGGSGSRVSRSNPKVSRSNSGRSKATGRCWVNKEGAWRPG
ncbi:hypothetical protein BDN67DRAFT_972077 [Paxillus ammoniavirescens]|nr:hypothetical protein BDN67DRAFT_972077 [Paxillus ammoniavirescens]